MVDEGCAKEVVQKKFRVNWKQESVCKAFLESCIHEISQYGREGGSLKANSWKRVAEKLKTEYEFIADQKQMKNRYDYLKSKFAAWSKLKNKTGNVYNPITNSFNFIEEEWQLEMKANKFVEVLRRAPLEHVDLCIQLFEGSTSNGFESWGPTARIPRTAVDMLDRNGLEEIDDTQMPQEVPSQESTDRSKNKRTQPTQVVIDEIPVQSKKTKGNLWTRMRRL